MQKQYHNSLDVATRTTKVTLESDDMSGSDNCDVCFALFDLDDLEELHPGKSGKYICNECAKIPAQWRGYARDHGVENLEKIIANVLNKAFEDLPTNNKDVTE